MTSVTQVEKEVYPLTDIYWGGGARVLPLVVHQNIYWGGGARVLPLVVHQNIYWGGGARVLPLVVHQNTGGEELGCSRWSFTEMSTSVTPSFFGNVGYTS